MTKIDAAVFLQIAMELEESLQVSYEILADVLNKPGEPAPKFLAEFAAEEDRHYKVFQQMLLDLKSDHDCLSMDLTDEQRLEFSKLIKSNVHPSLTAVKEFVLRKDITIESAFDMALQTERDTILFYSGMLIAMAGSPDATVVKNILDEERKHEQDLLRRRQETVAHR